MNYANINPSEPQVNRLFAAMQYVPGIGGPFYAYEVYVMANKVQKCIDKKDLQNRVSDHAAVFHNILEKKVIPFQKRLAATWSKSKWSDVALIMVAVVISDKHTQLSRVLSALGGISILSKKFAILKFSPMEKLGSHRKFGYGGYHFY